MTMLTWYRVWPIVLGWVCIVTACILLLTGHEVGAVGAAVSAVIAASVGVSRNRRE